MKHTYIQPAIYVVQVEVSEVICVSQPQQVDVPTGGAALEYDAPRVRLWGEE